MRYRFLATLLLIAVAPIVASCSAREKPSLQRQEIEVTLIPERHEIVGTSRIFMDAAESSRMTFTISRDASIVSTAINGSETPFSFMDGVLSVDIPRGGEGFSMEIRYRCSFFDHPPMEVVSGEDPTYGVNAIVSRKGVFLGPAAGWYPSPTIVPGLRIIKVNTPSGMEAVTVGRRTYRNLSEKGNTSTWEEKRPVGDISLSAGPYQVQERRLGNLPLYTYFTPENSSLADRYLEAAARYIAFYRDMFGPYPFEKFAIVENFFPTGYGFPSYTLLGSTIIRLPFILDTSLPHEIAHSWWGNGVLADSGSGNWSEGLVTYLADYLMEARRSPAAAREYRTIVLSDYASLVTPDRDLPLSVFTVRVDAASRSIGYGKGMMVFHMLRRKVGDDIFFRGLRDICREKMFRQVAWDDFIRVFARLSGKDLSLFKSEWIDRGGGPHLFLSDVKSERRGNDWIIGGLVEQKGDIFHLPLILEVETSEGKVRQSITSTGAATAFKFVVTSPPRRLVLDPDTDIFRILSDDEIPPTVNRIKGSSSLLVIAGSECRVDRENLDLLLKSLGQEGAEIITSAEAVKNRITGHDLLFCGMQREWQPDASLPLQISAKGFSVKGESYSAPGDAVFAVFNHPIERGRVAAVFAPNSMKAADDCLLKITHYGKYSYLAFSDGQNRVKGIAAASSGVSAVEFKSEGRQ